MSSLRREAVRNKGEHEANNHEPSPYPYIYISAGSPEPEEGKRERTTGGALLRRKREPENATGQSVGEILLGYRTAAVFDVSQTEGKPLPSIGKVHGDARRYGDRLSAYALSLGIRLEYSESIRPAHGIPEGGKITLLPDLGERRWPSFRELSRNEPERSLEYGRSAPEDALCRASGFLASGLLLRDVIRRAWKAVRDDGCSVGWVSFRTPCLCSYSPVLQLLPSPQKVKGLERRVPLPTVRFSFANFKLRRFISLRGSRAPRTGRGSGNRPETIQVKPYAREKCASCTASQTKI